MDLLNKIPLNEKNVNAMVMKNHNLCVRKKKKKIRPKCPVRVANRISEGGKYVCKQQSSSFFVMTSALS